MLYCRRYPYASYKRAEYVNINNKPEQTGYPEGYEHGLAEKLKPVSD